MERKTKCLLAPRNSSGLLQNKCAKSYQEQPRHISEYLKPIKCDLVRLGAAGLIHRNIITILINRHKMREL